MSENVTTPSDSEQLAATTETETAASEAVASPEAGAETESQEAATQETESGDDSADATDETEAPSYDALTLGDGWDVNQETMDAFKAALGENNASPELGQKLLDMYTSQKQAEIDAYAEQVKDWENQIKADKELGGKNLDATRAHAARAIDMFGSPDVREILDQTGVGNHPALVRMMARIGQEYQESNAETGQATVKADPLQTMYPTMFNN